MADAIVSEVAEQLLAVVKDQIQNEIHLVRGVDKEILDLRDRLMTIRNVLVDSENRQFKENGVRDWLGRLQQTSYEMDDVLGEWKYALLKHKMESVSTAATNHQVCSFNLSSCLSFKKRVGRRDLAMKILDLRSRLDQICKERELFNFVLCQPKDDLSSASCRVQSTTLMDLQQTRGRDYDMAYLVSIITSDRGSSCQIISIVGEGGIGKTTLAQLVYNDMQVRENFDVRIWVRFGVISNTFSLAKSIIENIEGRSYESIHSFEDPLEILKESISGKKFLLVLDDVWHNLNGNWAAFKNALDFGGTSSKILVTTRMHSIVNDMCGYGGNIHRLEFLSDEDCWLLIKGLACSHWSGMEFEYFEGIGMKIARKCRGLPLAAMALGGLLRFKNTIQEWMNVLHSEIWELQEREHSLFPPLLLSYNDLSPTLKLCFSYCAVFPEDEEIQVDHLIRIWMALGYLGSNIKSAGENMELKGRECFEALAERSLFQEFEKHLLTEQIISCKMHDIVRDFAHFLRMSGRVAAGMRNKICRDCNPLIVSHVQEYRTLFWGEESPPNLCCDCLKSLRVLGFKRELNGSLKGMENLIQLRWLDISGTKLSKEDLKTIFKLYFLQTLLLKLCSLEEIPEEIGNLVHLRHLHLNWNEELSELPNSTCSLHELQTLDIEGCSNLRELPEGLARLTGLRTLIEFQGGSGCNKLGLLKNLNHLTGSLVLKIKFSSTGDLEGLVGDAREAELRNKMDIQGLSIEFSDERDVEEMSSSLWMDLISALEPNQRLKFLKIWGYNGSALPDWISSPLNYVRFLSLYSFSHLSSMPVMGKLPFLEELHIEGLEELKLVGREFLGITREGEASSSTSTPRVAFRSLKELTFYGCPKWEVWEDITEEEEGSEFMPCLTHLSIVACEGLEMLPQRLLSNAWSLEMLDIRSSAKLQKLYGGEDGFPLSFIFNYPQVRLEM